MDIYHLKYNLNFTSRIQYLFYTLAFGYPMVALCCVLLGLESYWISATFRMIYLLLGLVIIFVNVAIMNKSIPKNREIIILFIFFGFAILRLMWDFLGASFFFGQALVQNIIWFLIVIIIPCAGFTASTDDLDGIILYKFMFYFIFITVLGWLFWGLFLDPRETFGLGRFGSPSLDPISMGHIGASLSLLSIYYIYGQSNLDGILKISGFLSGLILLFSSLSAGPFLAFVFTILSYILIKYSRGFTSILRIILFSGVVVILVFIIISVLELNYKFPMISLFVDKSTLDNQSTGARVELIKEALRIFIENPMLGGASSIPTLSGYPHNTIIESLMATGLVGTFLLVYVITLGGIKSAMLLRYNKNWGWLGLIFFQYWIASMFSGSIYASSGIEFYVLVAVFSIKTPRPKFLL